MSRSGFNRLIAFTSSNGRKYIGDAILDGTSADISKSRRARIIQGDIFGSYRVTEEESDVKQLHCPLSRDQISTVRCIGLNYANHAREIQKAAPKFPILFYKPVTAVAGPRDPIQVHPSCFEDGLDYECELVVVIGKEASNVAESDALDYVLGYTLGNDVSHRVWQVKNGGGQWGLGKGFDTWAPMGPGIVSPRNIKDVQDLRISTKVNGTTVQQSSTRDMIFSVARLIAFLSQGTTLLPGDLIFTGTPEGVGMSRKPPLWLKDGDLVEMNLENVGTIVNKVQHQRPAPKL